MLGDAGEQLDLDSLEEVGDERGKYPRRDRWLELQVGGPVGEDRLEQLAPACSRRAPACGQLGVGEAGGPQLPEHPHVARLHVVVEEAAGRAPFIGQRAGLGVEASLALEQLPVLALEHRNQQLLFAAEVVVDERQVDLGPLGDGAGSGAAVAALDKHVAGGVEDAKACRLPASRSSVGFA